MKALPFFLLLAFLTFEASSAQAQGVLLPDSGSSSEKPTGSMGLIPTVPVTPKQTAPTAKPRSPSPETAGLTPGGVIPKTDTRSKDRLTARQITSGNVVKPRPTSKFDMEIKAFFEAEEKKYERDPKFVTETPLNQESRKDLKSSLVVGISDQYLWGPQDLKMIQKRLGYLPEEVPQNCQLRLDVDLETESKDIGFSNTILAGTKKPVRYDNSALKHASLKPSALCKPPTRPLPRKGGIITKVGNLLSVLLLNEQTCLVPQNMRPAYLDVQYLGDGKVSCQFR